MHKPVWIRSNTWNFARTQILCFTTEEEWKFRQKHKLLSLWIELLHRTGHLLIKLGLKERPHLLKDTVIEMPDEAEYLLSLKNAKRLKGRKSIELIRVYDGQLKKWRPAEIWNAIANGPVFDQLDLPTRRDGKVKPKV